MTPIELWVSLALVVIVAVSVGGLVTWCVRGARRELREIERLSAEIGKEARSRNPDLWKIQQLFMMRASVGATPDIWSAIRIQMAAQICRDPILLRACVEREFPKLREVR